MRKNKTLRTIIIHHGLGIACLCVLAWSNGARAGETNDTARFSDQPAPLALEGFPERPAPLIEIGDKFLGNGNLQKGITLPTGEVISPNFWVFGTLRSAIQTFDTGAKGPNAGNSRTTEWANRLDIYGNLQFTPTERFVVGFRPLDQEYPDGSSAFTGYRIEPASSPKAVVKGQGTVEAFSATPRALFFEGEFGEMFPRLDDHDRLNLDYGFAVGRQPLTLQDGLLANTYSVDMFSITRNGMRFPGGSTIRVSGLVAVNDIQRQNYNSSTVPNINDPDALLFGLDSAADFSVSTVEANLLYETSGGHGGGVFAGLGAIQRLGKLNSSFRAVTSVAVNGDSSTKSPSRVDTGTLFLAQLSYPIPSSVDVFYMDAFWGIDRFTSAVRDPLAGGPLGDVGILTASVGLGSYSAPLSNQADHAAGGSIGYQMFFGELRRDQLIFEIGGRAPTQAPAFLRQQAAEAIGAQFEHAVGRRFILILAAFAVNRDTSGMSFGTRMEWLTKF